MATTRRALQLFLLKFRNTLYAYNDFKLLFHICLFIIYFLSLHVCGCMCACCVSEGQRITGGSQSFPSSVWVIRSNRTSSLIANVFALSHLCADSAFKGVPRHQCLHIHMIKGVPRHQRLHIQMINVVPRLQCLHIQVRKGVLRHQCLHIQMVNGVLRLQHLHIQMLHFSDNL